MDKLIIIDSGHNEYVSGKQSPDGTFKEWGFNNQMQYKLKKRCEDHNISVYLTNPSPQGKDEIGLTKRATLANTYWANQNKPKALFLSIHANAYLSYFNSARGTETYTASNASTNSKNAAKYVQENLVDAIKAIDSTAKDRGLKTADFTVIYKANMPSILVEYAFYTNKEDLAILNNNKDEMIEGTMKGLCKYFGITYKAPSDSNINDNTDDNNTDNGTIYYRVVVGSYTNKENAEAMVAELKSKGYDPFIVAYKKE
ncbi:N-acetylmuramoyl-L-alanine amidase [Romboutsia sp. 1001713B170207_170306_H8]|uniref:N-acetylmuramoyl-L-alanine amidase n=1 Tax=Romboutsia sp. 1001713B170207_170306_H8 TaxID=2787112 RepID=UPI00189BDC3E|nr:N-acetylmuramoyl-L-alanine amidase [Romboutsia sp. 1001713B170207_170306_H8]